ncbi:pollen-specific leucine-rich repeat extensin-like protein 4 [Iris pallida]|uniref:Pollen-specific leucine-rich repeat extensin-like protein 4 n=1 Tax=Iris pallida TaxID=29817 RepID=A0AAX6I3Q8_IRIPA|nr:pollen-specific leucine-rich repeat extensin-like protein 4 [Iris pallida]
MSRVHHPILIPVHKILCPTLDTKQNKIKKKSIYRPSLTSPEATTSGAATIPGVTRSTS